MVDHETVGPFELESSRLGALPIVGHLLGRMRLEARLERCLPAGDAGVSLAATTAIGVLARNLYVEREPLYGLAEWAGSFEPGLVGLAPGQAGLLNDDRVGRALDQLFDADRASLLAELVLGAIDEFDVDCAQLHNDSTSISLHGAYAAADGRERGDKPTPAAAFGHSKDHHQLFSEEGRGVNARFVRFRAQESLGGLWVSVDASGDVGLGEGRFELGIVGADREIHESHDQVGDVVRWERENRVGRDRGEVVAAIIHALHRRRAADRVGLLRRPPDGDPSRLRPLL